MLSPTITLIISTNVLSRNLSRVILVYRNLGNWSSVYYRLPGYSFLSSVVGLLAYSAVDLTAKGLPELDLRTSENPILVKFETLGVSPDGVLPKCVFFDLFGGVVFDRVLNRSICSSETQGHFGIVVEERTPSPVPAPPKVPEYPIAGGESTGGGGGRKKGWWIGGSVADGVLLAVVLAILVLWVRWCSGRKRIGKMKDAAEGGAPLAVAAVGRAKVPVAMGTLTKPVFENEYVSADFRFLNFLFICKVFFMNTKSLISPRALWKIRMLKELFLSTIDLYLLMDNFMECNERQIKHRV
ncbi:hypothetical protein LXL04_010915 [Taraxacum kok-saghyz]